MLIKTCVSWAVIYRWLLIQHFNDISLGVFALSQLDMLTDSQGVSCVSDHLAEKTKISLTGLKLIKIVNLSFILLFPDFISPF